MTGSPSARLRLCAGVLASGGFLCPTLLPAQEPDLGTGPAALRFSVQRGSGPIEVDGVLNEPAWGDATPVLLPFEWFPGDNEPAPVETEVRIFFDDENLYLGFRAHDPDPSAIRANLADRDTPFQDDHVGFMVDPFNDERRGFQFRINPLGVQMDAIFSENEGYEDFSWDAIWDTDGKITEEGYVVEVAVPFKSLRFPRTAEPQTWGFMAFRSYPRDVRHRMRSHPTDRNRACILCQMNKMEGIQGVDPGRNVEVAPTLTAVRTDTRPEWPSGSWEDGDGEYEPGVTARWSMTPNLVFNGAVNPDFSQVEADVAQLEVNNRFALYYPERRPFFLEGADFFLTPLNVVFTRTVADPSVGAKVTGKEGANAVGFFLTQDRVNNLIFPANQGSRSASLRDEVTAGVLRYRRDVGEGSTLGGLVTLREGEDYHNRVYGADAFLRLSPTNTIQGQFLRSDTEYPAEIVEAFGQEPEAFQANALFLQFLHRSRDWMAVVNAKQLDEGFRADAGFIPRVDTRSGDVLLQRTWWASDPGAWYSFLNAGILVARTEDLDGRLTDERVQINGGYSGPWQSAVNVALARRKELHAETLFRDLDAAYVGFEIRPSGLGTFGFGTELSKTIDYLAGEAGTQITAGPSADLKLGRHLNLELRHSFRRLERNGDWAFIANLSQIRAVYNFNVRTFFRAIVQYQNIERNPDNYAVAVDREARTFLTQLLFSYKVNPQTVVFLGYSDNAMGLLTQEWDRTDLTRTDRTFFLKLGYAWRP
ncbi:MAG: carbohydrate binding family 9 domain-containing protein [Longimicrobiales bacterium]